MIGIDRNCPHAWQAFLSRCHADGMDDEQIGDLVDAMAIAEGRRVRFPDGSIRRVEPPSQPVTRPFSFWRWVFTGLGK
jgi:hypothetical protein